MDKTGFDLVKDPYQVLIQNSQPFGKKSEKLSVSISNGRSNHKVVRN